MISDMRQIIHSLKIIIEENNIDTIAIEDDLIIGDEIEIDL